MDLHEEKDAGEEPVEVEVKRTRSGRTLASPAVAKKATGGRKTRKKVVMIEVEVSDEEAEKDNIGEHDKAKRRKTDDTAEPLIDEQSSEQPELLEKPDLDNSDNAVEASDMRDNTDSNVVCEDSNSIINDFQSFKGAESSSDALNNESNSCFDIAQESNGQDALIQSDTNESNDDKKVTAEENENTIKSEKDVDVKMDEGVEIEADVKTDVGVKMDVDDQVEDIKSDEEDMGLDVKPIQPADPDAENISEDELPAVQAVKVPETEEVSDEELPGPKRAELPADTEVVSEDELETVKKDSNKRKLAEGDYDPGSPTSETETAPKKPALDKVEEEGELKEKPKKLPELDKYWKAVNDDPTDFTGWTYLLQYVDQENDMEAAREAYDAFLSHYPYCYGYWRKYADYEKRKGNKKKCDEVFERGLKAIPLSVDLWIHYLTYVKTTRSDDEEFVRSQFERALKACGLEFRSDRLWEGYIKWEAEGKRLQNITAVYERLLATPTQGYLQHFDNFQEHVHSNQPNKILEVDEFLALRKEVKALLKPDVAEVADNPDIPPGEDTSENTDEEMKAIRERIISIRRKVHKNTSTAVTSRWNFEEGIKRPYFHVKPLERCQLKNWQEYLDYEIAQADESRIIVLFERCLIACALYEEFWLRFVHYLQGLKSENFQVKIKDVFERACTIHHLKKPNIHLQWAVFEESVQNYNKAAEILQNLDKTVPNLLQVAYRRINLERRRKDFDKSCQLFEHYMNNSKNKTISSNMAVKYARFLLKILNNSEKALEILTIAIAKDSSNPRLYLQAIDINLHKEGMNEADILKLIDTFLEKEGVDAEQKVLFAQRKLEFLEDFGSDIQGVQKAYEDYQKYLKASKEKKKDPKTDSKKDKVSSQPASSSNSYNYGNYNNSTPGSYQYNSSQQSAYGQYPQYGSSDQYQYGWQYQGNYSGYNQWGGYGSGYSY